jgi:hypothetical protein
MVGRGKNVRNDVELLMMKKMRRREEEEKTYQDKTKARLQGRRGHGLVGEDDGGMVAVCVWYVW